MVTIRRSMHRLQLRIGACSTVSQRSPMGKGGGVGHASAPKMTYAVSDLQTLDASLVSCLTSTNAF